MKKGLSITVNIVWLLIAASGAGCGYLQTEKSALKQQQYNSQPETNTKITKDVLRERLNGKAGSFIETSPCDKQNLSKPLDIPEPLVKKSESVLCDKQNALSNQTRVQPGLVVFETVKMK